MKAANRTAGTNRSAGSSRARLTRRELVHRIRKQPNDPLLLASLANVCMEESDYVQALKASRKAYALAPANPLVLWDHARALYLNRRFDDAVPLHRRILQKKLATIAREMRWPEDKARQFQGASQFDLALCYIQLDKLAVAAEKLRAYLARCRRQVCYYAPDLARAKLRSIVTLRRQAACRAARLWIGFLEIRSSPKGRLRKYGRGFTNGLVMARTRNEAKVRLAAGLKEIGYELVTMEDMEEFDRRMLKTELPDSTRTLADNVRRDGKTRFTDFCMYPSKPAGKRRT